MKKITCLFSFILLGSMLLWTSCAKDDEPNPDELKPNLNFKGGPGYISQDATLNVLEAFTIGISASANNNSGAKLTNFKITRTVDNQVWFDFDSVLNNVEFFNVDVKFQSLNMEKTERIAFKITDKDGYSNEVALNITTESAAGPINWFTQKWLGSYANPDTGSSFASIDGTVYKIADAKANSGKVDLVYFYGATYGATIAAPDDGIAETVFSGPDGLATWDTRNSTRFKKCDAASIDFDAIQDDTAILEQTETGVTNSRISNTEDGLAEGDILAFITEGGKHGLIRIDEIIPGTAGSMAISVKVQQ